MELRLFNRLRNSVVQKSLVLMYHKIAEQELDIWDLAVSPDRFEQQLQVLKKKTKIVSLQQLMTTKSRFKNRVAITFDDGYMDNIKMAKPILEKYQVPATFFVTSRHDQHECEYWWDILENCILNTENLPPVFMMFIEGKEFVFCLEEETYLTTEIFELHKQWKAYLEDPPTLRAKLYYELWLLLKVLPFKEQKHYLKKIQQWAQVADGLRADYRTMSASDLELLANSSLFTIGSHTANHPSLAQHDAAFQKREIVENRDYLEKIVGRKIQFLAYPYGNCNNNTLAIARDVGFDAAFTTEERTFDSSAVYSVGRFQVKNLTGGEFRNQLKNWLL
ncbi:polysaccharide deacetylase family protein [Pedobacter immunditicola]|uniref:polysaccharide deacetylase family protein n=1 Tax=Pedobacter immunditicola TaxID=3133440 RepID=UPI0030963554